MYEYLKKILFKLDPENAHDLAITLLKSQNYLKCFDFSYNNDKLKVSTLGIDFKNPIGLAAGFDKNANILNALAYLGFGFIEIGAITPLAQSGNPKPRLWRLKEEQSLQNAFGFNNDGVKVVKNRLSKYNFNKLPPIFINVGKNKFTKNEDAINDYESVIKELDCYADAFVINISSPNTPNLRSLQNKDFINELFTRLTNISKKPILLKLSPDMNIDEANLLISTAKQSGAKGLILTNTSTDYSLSPNAKNIGGISGALLKEKSLTMLKNIQKYDDFCIISSGGISTADDVYERLELGAKLVQIYTSFIYNGPKSIYNINKNLCQKI
ncbi:quinone-dependent dihydroorotate dehydrogenase [Campylobacter canadensis]|uniref:quinone-dependent dihydroorotate dehydrogenase n=1 Tax=Campylobacter canadensis TaxID=449520 RepID=UPI001552371A|nr:quinone-dependent dihydroorotate dehydrogenase [Campylobacter canadensis]MBZ7997363.1 quinone-dependent dihydroorotate dehydrogenase [Campylobacter canadensis]MBZ8000923.1 quinone-dependent dihydroorotate dehydrogenase [Campylobacter canadensis]MBZ8002748.1 quinone-dependent dihydroorotate dehydrogenase [Campylobacter canadensis]MBZ8004344.1 quinone-dependent dihydroorotate dehydrogenase [Campylobacter canadensis]